MPGVWSRYAVGLLSLVALAAVACGGGSDNSGAGPAATDFERPSLNVFLIARDLAIGEARVPISIQRIDQTRIEDRTADLSITYRHVDDDEFIRLGEVVWRAWPISGGVYVTRPVFDRAGAWEFRVTAQDAGNELDGAAFVQVNETSATPGIGEPAPKTETPLATTVEEVRQISSAFNPDPGFHSISLGDAVSSGLPTVVLFSTPAFCATQTCGPQLDTLAGLKDQYGDRAHFIHVEIWQNVREMLNTGEPGIGVIAQAVTDWNLPTEPYTFFVDGDGNVFEKFEAFTTESELRDAFNRLLAG